MEDLLNVESPETEQVPKLPTYKFSYIWSKDGFFKVIEVILGIITSIAILNYWWRLKCWILFGINCLVTLYSTGTLIAATVKTNKSPELWTEKTAKLDYIFNIVCFVLMFVAFIIQIAPYFDMYEASSCLLLTLFIFFGLHCLRSYRIYKGRYPWGGKSIMKAVTSKLQFGTNNYYMIVSQNDKNEVIPMKLSEFEERVRVGMI